MRRRCILNVGETHPGVSMYKDYALQRTTRVSKQIISSAFLLILYENESIFFFLYIIKIILITHHY